MVLLVEDDHWPSCLKETNAHKVNDCRKNYSETEKELYFISETYFVVLEAHHSDKWMQSQNNGLERVPNI